MKTRLFLVDDEPAVLRGLRLFLGLQPNLAVCGEAGSEQAALEGIQAAQPDLAMVDLSLKQGDGLRLIQRLHQVCSRLKILVFSTHDEAYYATNAFRAGAHGYVTKEEGTEKALEAIGQVMSGKYYLSEKIAAKAPDLLSGAHSAAQP